ncbi:MAG: DUF4837 family protein [Bacteroidales bacterium]|nr:DUF4837 family protein [Bacteroidales bacterium]
MNNKYVFYAAICFLYTAVACTMQQGTTTLPEARGKQGEIVVVISKELWTGACGDTIRSCLNEPVYGLPAPEPVFTLVRQDVLTGFTQQVRNILLIEVNPAVERSTLSYKTDVYAKRQLLFHIQSPSADSLTKYVKRCKDLLIDRYLTQDRDSYIAYYTRIADASFAGKTREKFQADIAIPKEYSLDVEKEDFLWFAREKKDMLMGILMWKEAYSSTDRLNPDRLLSKMNEMSKKYVPGPSPGSYMATESLLPPAVKQYVKNNVYTVQLNGLWQTENDFMGGPYVNMSIVDERRGQIVTGVGFVFFPRKDKRDYIRQLEAILYTLAPAQ